MTNGWIWSKRWVTAWAVVAVVVPALVFVLPFAWWVLLAAGTFGPMESFALWHGRRYPDPRFAPYPPLTYAAVYGVPPLWFVYTYTGWVIGTAGREWLSSGAPAWKVGALLATALWLSEHWRTTALEQGRPR